MPRAVNLSIIPLTDKSCEVDAEGMMGTTTMVLPLSLEQLQKGVAAWDGGAYVQDCFPTLNAGQREFLMTGITPAKFQRMFAPEPEDN